MVHCVAPSCKNNSLNGKLLSWHSLPVNKPWLLKQWLINIGREDIPTSQFSRLCSDHFEEECFVRDFRAEQLDQRCKDGRRRSRKLKSGAIPTIFKPSLPNQIGNQTTPIRRKINKHHHHVVFNNGNQIDFFGAHGIMEQLTAAVRPFTADKTRRSSIGLLGVAKDSATQTALHEAATLNRIPETETKMISFQPVAVNLFVAGAIEIGKLYSDLQFVVFDSIVEFTRRGWHGIPCMGQTPVKLQFFANGEVWQVILFQQPQMMRYIIGNDIKSSVLHELFQNLSTRGGFLFCCGLQSSNASAVQSRPSLLEFHYPCHRQQSVNCLGYFQPPAGYVRRTNEATLGLGTCTECLKAARILQQDQEKLKDDMILITELQ